MTYQEYKRVYNSNYPYNHLTIAQNSSNSHLEEGHDHEFTGSTKLAEEGDERHNHRFAGVTGRAIPTNGNHVHKLCTNTDFFDHFHVIKDTTGPAINVGQGKHVHLVKGVTSFVDGHVHKFIFATLIESPLLPQPS